MFNYLFSQNIYLHGCIKQVLLDNQSNLYINVKDNRKLKETKLFELIQPKQL